jgi:hypothetical protein
MHVHTKGVDSLQDKISKHILPDEYGGAAGALNDLWGKLATLRITCNTEVKQKMPGFA